MRKGLSVLIMTSLLATMTVGCASATQNQTAEETKPEVAENAEVAGSNRRRNSVYANLQWFSGR